MPNGAGTKRRSRSHANASGLPRTSLHPLKPSKAFSLIELLIVVALLVIAGAFYGGTMSTRRQSGAKSACSKSLQKIYVALNLYQLEHNGLFPVVTNAQTSAAALAPLVPKYTVETKSFICPGIWEQKDLPIEKFGKQTISYSYYMGLSYRDAGAALMTDRQVDGGPKTNGQPIFSGTGRPPGNNHGKSGGNVLFTDGSMHSIGTNAPFPLLLSSRTTLLNP